MENNIIEKGFVNLYKKLKRINLNDRDFVKTQIIDMNLNEFKELYEALTTINWDCDICVDEAYDTASFAIYNVNYILITQMVMLEYAENYEAASIIYDLIYQTYYLIGEQLSPDFDSQVEKQIIKDNIKIAVEEVKYAIQTIEEKL